MWDLIMNIVAFLTGWACAMAWIATRQNLEIVKRAREARENKGSNGA